MQVGALLEFREAARPGGGGDIKRPGRASLTWASRFPFYCSRPMGLGTRARCGVLRGQLEGKGFLPWRHSFNRAQVGEECIPACRLGPRGALDVRGGGYGTMVEGVVLAFEAQDEGAW